MPGYTGSAAGALHIVHILHSAAAAVGRHDLPLEYLVAGFGFAARANTHTVESALARTNACSSSMIAADNATIVGLAMYVYARIEVMRRVVQIRWVQQLHLLLRKDLFICCSNCRRSRRLVKHCFHLVQATLCALSFLNFHLMMMIEIRFGEAV